MQENSVETVQEEATPNPFPVDVLIHFATEAWESLDRSADMRGVDIEAALSTAIGLLELVETDKKNGIELYRKVGNRYEIVRYR